MFVDTHCHIHKRDFDKIRDDVIETMAINEVTRALIVAITTEDAKDAIKLAEKHEGFYASVGVHPGPKDAYVPSAEELIKMADHPKVIAIGECGLDYYRAAPKQKWQIDRFRMQIQASRMCGKPLIIHTRQAVEDTIAILREEGAGLDKGGYAGIMHCFSEDMKTARAALDMGFYISFSGVLTYPANKNLRSIARLLPLDRLLIETDSPWLTPQAYRGKAKINQPAYVIEVAEQLAMIRGMNVEKLAEITMNNFKRLFNLD